jgi:hypothetical protein
MWRLRRTSNQAILASFNPCVRQGGITWTVLEGLKEGRGRTAFSLYKWTSIVRP